ncbi:MAG: outer membrane beta-barrel protein [Sedimentisphaerales bacterium]|jgi:opacity protein-like surface antigen
MNKKLLLVVVIFAVLALISSAAMAMAPLGTPTADLKAGQFGVGLDYAYASTKIKIDGEGDRLKTNMFMADLGYGVMDDLKGFVRLGVGDARAEGFSGDYKFAWGWGTKYTFLKQDNLDWGALFQMNWLRSEDKIAGETAKLKPYDIVLAVGPNYQVSQDLSIYGGPLLQWMRGKATFAGESGNIKEKSLLGGYVGVQATLCPNTSWYGELQLTGFTGYAIGTGITWKF